ncbi:hypothetical protein AgCh_018011 [Apium graveolens]
MLRRDPRRTNRTPDRKSRNMEYARNITIRDNYQLDITPLDDIYGVLKTYKLEMEQRRKRKGSKARPVALKVEDKP